MDQPGDNAAINLPGDNAAYLKPQPVRPLDPAWLLDFLSNSGLNKKTANKFVAAIEKYNKAVNKAGATLEKDLKAIRINIL